MLFIYVQCTIKPDKVDEFVKINEEFVRETRKESGCVSFNIGQLHDTDNVYVYIEQFKDQAALDSHHKTEHFLRLAPQIDVLFEKKDIYFHDIVEWN